MSDDKVFVPQEFAGAAFVEFEVLNWLRKEELTPHQLRLRCLDSEKIITTGLLGAVLGDLLRSGKIQVTKFESDHSYPVDSDTGKYPFTVFLKAAQ